MPFDSLGGNVLAKLRDWLQDMKPMTLLLLLGSVYTYAMVRTKTLLESPDKMTICEYVITKRACSVLAKF